MEEKEIYTEQEALDYLENSIYQKAELLEEKLKKINKEENNNILTFI